MKASLEEAKSIVLTATYETLYSHAEWEEFTAIEIHKRVDTIFSLGFTRRVLNSLSELGLVEQTQFDETSSVVYSLTDKGLEAAERSPPLDALTARLRDYSLGTLDRIEVPASDRIVTLSHNEIRETEEPLSEIIAALDADNGNPDFPGLREQIVGQIKAGRELIRAGQFRAYLLYEVLVRALYELINKYGNSTIAALANALLGAIVGQMMQAK